MADRLAAAGDTEFAGHADARAAEVGSSLSVSRQKFWLEGTFDKRRYERANTLTRPGSALHSMTVTPWSSTTRVTELRGT
jgi:hypothetical protein